MKFNSLKKILFIIIFAIIGTLGITNDAYAKTDPSDTSTSTSTDKKPIAVTCVANATGAKGSIDCADANPLAEKIEGVVKTMTGLVGAFAVGMIVYGGFKYITSQGDPKAAEGAKNIIWYAGVGLFIVLLAFMIFSLVQNALNIGT